MREEFEKWAIDNGFSIRFDTDNNEYSHASTRNAFRGFLGGREAIEIELPEPNAHLIWIQAGYAPDDYWDDVEVSRSKEDKCCDGSDRYEVYAKWQLEEVFTSHGIRIKGKTE